MSSAVSASAGSKDRDATVSQEVFLCAAAPPPGSSALGGVEHSDSGSVPSRRVKPRQMVNKLVLERSSVVRDQWGCEAVSAAAGQSDGGLSALYCTVQNGVGSSVQATTCRPLSSLRGFRVRLQ